LISQNVLIVDILLLLPRADGFEITMGQQINAKSKTNVVLFFLAEQAQLFCFV
jgi:hypothetical protein